MSPQMEFDFDGIYDELRDVGVVNSQSELSRMMGKDDSYISSRKAKLADPSVEAVLHLVFKLEKQRKAFEKRIRTNNISNEELIAASTLYRVQNRLYEELRQMLDNE